MPRGTHTAAVLYTPSSSPAHPHHSRVVSTTAITIRLGLSAAATTTTTIASCSSFTITSSIYPTTLTTTSTSPSPLSGYALLPLLLPLPACPHHTTMPYPHHHHHGHHHSKHHHQSKSLSSPPHNHLCPGRSSAADVCRPVSYNRVAPTLPSGVGYSTARGDAGATKLSATSTATPVSPPPEYQRDQPPWTGAPESVELMNISGGVAGKRSALVNGCTGVVKALHTALASPPACPCVGRLMGERLRYNSMAVWSTSADHTPPSSLPPPSHNTQRLFYSRSCHQRGQAAPEHTQLLTLNVVASPPAQTC
ncbi:hypothetical protein E2C01_016601 [Portunus trituberculatus]|uniref:Uncharacterized protein n=1 Tax=Portunus trituberculatus TaxID=210409 RepID=A0A5B7DR00_PORTR|nr:hypothetical protein [Portunus trituberculatus]